LWARAQQVLREFAQKPVEQERRRRFWR
jgi:hypothetical protein